MPTTRDGSALGRMAVRVAAWEAAAASERPRWRGGSGRWEGEKSVIDCEDLDRCTRIDRRCLGRRHLFVAGRRRGEAKARRRLLSSRSLAMTLTGLAGFAGSDSQKPVSGVGCCGGGSGIGVFAGVGITVIIVGEWPSGPPLGGSPRSGFPSLRGFPHPLPTPPPEA